MTATKPESRQAAKGVWAAMFALIVAVSLVSFPAAAPSRVRANPAGESSEPCHCESFKINNGWCGHCKIGFVASIPVPSYLLFETLDAHGHQVDPKSIKCSSCVTAMATGGFCDRCQMGFVKGLAYVSRLTYHLAKGQARDVAKLECATCRTHSDRHGWCAECKTGMVGNVAFESKADFQSAAEELDFLQTVIEMLDKCEICAVAKFTGGRCPKCKVLYSKPPPGLATRNPTVLNPRDGLK